MSYGAVVRRASRVTPTSGDAGIENKGFDAADDADGVNGAAGKPEATMAPFDVDGPESEEAPTTASAWNRFVGAAQDGVSSFFARHGRLLRQTWRAALALLYLAYFVAAVTKTATISLRCDEAVDEDACRLEQDRRRHRADFLIVATVVLVVLVVYEYVVKPRATLPALDLLRRLPRLGPRAVAASRVVFGVVLVVVVVVLLVVVGGVARHPASLISGVGLVAFVGLVLGFSRDPGRVRWRPVVGGFALQFLVAVVVLKTRLGFCFFEFGGEQIKIFLDYSVSGSDFVFNLKALTNGDADALIFAFQVLPIVIFFSSFVAILYHVGIMIYVVKKVAEKMLTKAKKIALRPYVIN